MSIKKGTLKASNNAELLSYIINVTPELKADIDLPVQGESIKPIGEIIINNLRYKNAFINTINLLGLTVIKRNGWDNPWQFTRRGSLSFGQQIREILVDLARVNDYNENVNDVTKFLENSIPKVYNYIHEVNFQKYYDTTTSDAQIAMAFTSEDGLFQLIDETIGMLYESLKYDTFLVDKYQLCRRILDGTVTAVNIPDYASLTPRARVAFMKNVSNLMTFRNPNYNPAGVRKATSFEDQILIMSSLFQSDLTTEVLATSYFRNDAEFKTNLALIDSFSATDEIRLAEVLGLAYKPFTDDEKTALATIPSVIISREWFMDYDYLLDTASDTKLTDFYNPTQLRRNIFLHAWRVFSTSPYEQACVFTTQTVGVNSVTVSPSTATLSVGQDLQLKATVVTTGFANKAVAWSVDADAKADGVTIDVTGKLVVPATATVASITVTATSIYDQTVTGTATITVAENQTQSVGD